MKTREELIKQCRYYKGEEECPEFFFEKDDYSYSFWCAEYSWVANYNNEDDKSSAIFWQNTGALVDPDLANRTNTDEALLGSLFYITTIRYSDIDPTDEDVKYFINKVLKYYFDASTSI